MMRVQVVLFLILATGIALAQPPSGGMDSIIVQPGAGQTIYLFGLSGKTGYVRVEAENGKNVQYDGLGLKAAEGAKPTQLVGGYGPPQSLTICQLKIQDWDLITQTLGATVYSGSPPWVAPGNTQFKLSFPANTFKTGRIYRLFMKVYFLGSESPMYRCEISVANN